MNWQQAYLPVFIALWVATACTASSTAAWALDVPDDPLPDLENPDLLLEVFVNKKSSGFIGSFQKNLVGQIKAKIDELESFGIKSEEDEDGDGLILLDDLTGLAYVYDEPRQRLDLTVTLDRLATLEFDASPVPRPEKKPRADLGMKADYVLFAAVGSTDYLNTPAFEGASLHFDALSYSNYGRFSQSGLVKIVPGTGARFNRLNTTFTSENEENSRVMQVGDFVSDSLPWMRSVRMAGIQFSRDFSLRPDLITTPLPTVSGTAAVPSSLEIYNGNTKTYSQDLPEGPYSVRNLPTLTSSGRFKVIIKGSNGQETESTLPFYTSSDLLKKGLSDFSAQLGFVRRDFGSESDQYALGPAFVSSYRYGLSDGVTLEGAGELTANLINLGAGFVTNFGKRGIFSGSASGSWRDNNYGFSVNASLDTSFWGMHLNIGTSRTFGQYEDIASATARGRSSAWWSKGINLATFGADNFAEISEAIVGYSPSVFALRAADRISLSTPLPFDRSSLAIGVTHVKTAGDVRNGFASASFSKLYRKQIHFSLSGLINILEPSEFRTYAGVAFPLGDKINVDTNVSGSQNGISGNLKAVKGLGSHVGDHGWSLAENQASSGSSRRATGSYRTHFGRVGAGLEHTDSNLRAKGELEGSLVFSKLGIFASNRLNDSFGVVNVGVPDVVIMHQNRNVGATNRNGGILVPNLSPLQKNTISLDMSSLPADVTVDQTEVDVVPKRDSGINIDLEVDTNPSSATVILYDEEGKVLTTGLVGTLLASGEEFTIGYDGTAYLNGLSENNEIEVDLLGATCNASFAYEAVEGDIPEIDNVVCR